MSKQALVVIDIQNGITRHYRHIIANINKAIGWAEEKGMEIVYIKHNELSASARLFIPGTPGTDLAPDLHVITENIFTKTKPNALSSQAFTDFISAKKISEFYVCGADATVCVKSTSYNMAKEGFKVHVLSDCITSYSLGKIAEMLEYYASRKCIVQTLSEAMGV